MMKLEPLTNEQLTEKLIELWTQVDILSIEVAQQAVFSTALLNNLVNSGLVSKEQLDLQIAMIKEQTGFDMMMDDDNNTMYQ